VVGATHALIEAANEAGGRDNIAVVLVAARGASGASRSWWPFGAERYDPPQANTRSNRFSEVTHGQTGCFAGWRRHQGGPADQGQDHAGPPLQRHRHRQPCRQRRARRAADGGQDVFIEDQNSTNGTYINGKAVKKQLLQHNDTVEIGKYKIKYLVEEGSDYEKTMIMRRGPVQDDPVHLKDGDVIELAGTQMQFVQP
jgi:hypothetical protein